MNLVILNKSTRALILIMIALVAIGYFIARTYYDSANKSVDPRIIPARELYDKYDEYAREGNYYRIFSLLDSVENIYREYEHYSNSFELGVLYNNRAAALITISLFRDSIRADYNPFSEVPNDSLLSIAESNLDSAINIYDNFIDKYEGKDEEDIYRIIDKDFSSDLHVSDNELAERYRANRVDEISAALKESGRRLSVAYTNLGVIKRQREEYREAARYYEKALELWDRNLSAENNLNALLGRPLKKRNFIQKMFPPEK